MFSRRHPFLFFSMFMVACMTCLILGMGGLMLLGSRMAQSASIYASGKANVGIVEVSGPILSSKKIIKDLTAFRDNPAIKAIILRIESPGGGIGPSQEIYREVIKTRKTKKVIASMGSVAASGGYYIAAACDRIVANAGTITGSIGVIMEYANLMEIARKIGISPVVVKSGEFKDMGSPMREPKEKERKLFQNLVDELHDQFVKDAAKARKMELGRMAKLADGRVYTGQTALKLNLVDRLGNLDDAVQWVATLAGIKEKPVTVYPKEDKVTFIRRLTQTLLKDIQISGSVTDNFRFIIN